MNIPIVPDEITSIRMKEPFAPVPKSKSKFDMDIKIAMDRFNDNPERFIRQLESNINFLNSGKNSRPYWSLLPEILAVQKKKLLAVQKKKLIDRKVWKSLRTKLENRYEDNIPHIHEALKLVEYKLEKNNYI